MAMLETPMGLSLLICDTVIEDKLTGKKSLVGLFDRVHAQRLPCVHPAMAVFVSVTGGRGEYPCEIVCKHQDGETLAFDAKGKVNLRDPRQVVDLVFRLSGVRFPKDGLYWLTFQMDEIPIMMRPLQVKRREAKGASGESPRDETAGG
jgi:hypothetical protein